MKKMILLSAVLFALVGCDQKDKTSAPAATETPAAVVASPAASPDAAASPAPAAPAK